MNLKNYSGYCKKKMIKNIFKLPLTFLIGMAMEIFDFMPSLQENQSLVLAVDAIHPRDYTERLHIGG